MKNGSNFSVQGFTLIELLIVIIIIGVLSSITVFSVTGNDTRVAENEARRLHKILKIAAEEAIFQKKEIGFRITKKSYEFLELNEENNQWVIIENNKILADYELPENITIGAELEGKTIKSDSNSTKPVIIFLSNGEITPFIIRIGTAKKVFTIKTGETGNIIYEG